MQTQTGFLYDADGNPFHSEETTIYRDVDGSLIYVCPQCGEGYVPSRQARTLEKYAQPKP